MKPLDDCLESGRSRILLAVTLLLGLLGGIVLDPTVAAGIGSFGGPRDGQSIPDAWRIFRRVYVDRAAAQQGAMAYGVEPCQL